MKPTAAEETAGQVGTDMAKAMIAKVTQAIDGFPASSPEQKAAIAGLVAEGLEDYQDRALRGAP